MLPVGSAGDREILLTSRTHGTSGKAVGGGEEEEGWWW